MKWLENLAFVVFPYITLTTFVVGHAYRYITDAFGWNAQSSELLDKDSLRLGITVFHWGILLTLFGHAGGLLIPQTLFDAMGINGETHTEIAYYSGWAVGLAAFAGSLLLLRRRWTSTRVHATTAMNDLITLTLLVWTISTGLYNVAFGHYYVLDTVAPWIRGIVTLGPDPTLMREVPLSYKVHILSALALLGFSPFSRLVHIWSIPLTYFPRRYVLYRRREERPAEGLSN
jgi:nitrate reductase gamma subunit